ncbi:MAG: hypothetical protein AAB383_01445 [Patescibacteria group bacterium]
MAKLTPLEQVLHQQFSEYGQNAREWTRKCILLLPEIDRLKIWRKKKFSSIYEYAAKLAGMSRYTVDEALRVLQKIADKPALLDLVKEKGLYRVKPVANLVTEENQSFWAEKIKSMSKHTLTTYVKDYRVEFRPGPESLSEKVVLELRPELAKQLKEIQKRSDFEEILEKVLKEAAAREKIEQPSPVQSNSRYIPKAIVEYVDNRTSSLCSYPSCKRPATSLHHTQRFALEKVHDPGRLRPLCTAHERIAHLGLIENEDQATKNWRLRTSPDKTDPKFYIDSMVAHFRPT